MRAIVFEPRIETVRALVPESYDSSRGKRPPKDFVVSRKRDGSVASVYSDSAWDWTSYVRGNQRKSLNFEYWRKGESESHPIRAGLIEEVRWFMFLIIWMRPGPTLSFATLCNYLTALRHAAIFCEEKCCLISDLLVSPARIGELVEVATGGVLRHLGSIGSMLISLGSEKVGFPVPSRATIDNITTHVRIHLARLKQHPPIPSRILSKFILVLAEELDKFEEVADRVLDLVAECASDPFVGRKLDTQKSMARRKGVKLREFRPEFPELLKKYGLEQYLSETCNVSGLSAAISNIQLIAKFTIHAFSGMRDQEASFLPYDCVETFTHNGKVHRLIVGSTTKFNNGKPKRARWVTSPEGHRAIEVARRISSVIYSAAIAANPRRRPSSKEKYLLFVSPSNLPFSSSRSEAKNDELTIPRGAWSDFPQFLMPTIQDGDLSELEQIDSHRPWRSEEKFKVGNLWKVTAHQLRRSLALYAQRSGLVSLPTLRRQLQHITEEMSRYYARGSYFAKDLIGGDQRHFGYEWQQTQPISSGLSYLLNVVFSDSELFGGHGNFVQHRLRDSQALVDRDVMLSRFQRGEISYKETALGGCVKVGACDEVGFRLLSVDCISSCKHLVGRVSKLETVISAQTKLVDALDPDSVEFRMEGADLGVLVSAREAIRKEGKTS